MNNRQAFVVIVIALVGYGWLTGWKTSSSKPPEPAQPSKEIAAPVGTAEREKQARAAEERGKARAERERECAEFPDSDKQTCLRNGASFTRDLLRKRAEREAERAKAREELEREAALFQERLKAGDPEAWRQLNNLTDEIMSDYHSRRLACQIRGNC